MCCDVMQARGGSVFAQNEYQRAQLDWNEPHPFPQGCLVAFQTTDGIELKVLARRGEHPLQWYKRIVHPSEAPYKLQMAGKGM